MEDIDHSSKQNTGNKGSLNLSPSGKSPTKQKKEEDGPDAENKEDSSIKKQRDESIESPIRNEQSSIEMQSPDIKSKKK